ncbi:MAG: hypothetical protein GX248_01790 [Peptococcaceae bacterium]|jgi:uncharacterized membrane protein|nr:hypothetical protein [Peptococcaceae bacterium]
MLRRFLFYGFLGWTIEIMFTGMDSLIRGDLRLFAFTNLWMFFIYGLAVFLEPVHDRITGWKWPFRGMFWMLLFWGIEYVTGFMLVNILGVYPWHYTDLYAINGLITLRFAPFWFAAGLLFEKIHRFLDSLEIVRYRR